MTTPTVTGTIRNGNHVGERMELGRYRTAAGVEHVLYGQRVAYVVRFLPRRPVVLDASSCISEDGRCRPRERPLKAPTDGGAIDGTNGNALEGES